MNACPIICSIYPDGGIFVVYYGPSKPDSVEDFLSRFINDVNDFTIIGIKVNHTTYYGEIFFIVCNLVAKAYILCATYHSGYCSCFKCKVEGIDLHKSRCCASLDCEKRTDHEMRSALCGNDRDYRTSLSPLEKIPGLNLVDQIPLDNMHQICLGVVRALIGYFVFGLRLKKYEKDKRTMDSSSVG